LVACPGGCHSLQLWSRKLEHGRRAMAFLNVSPEEVQEQLCIPWKVLGWLEDTKAQVSLPIRTCLNTTKPKVTRFCGGRWAVTCTESNVNLREQVVKETKFPDSGGCSTTGHTSVLPSGELPHLLVQLEPGYLVWSDHCCFTISHRLCLPPWPIFDGSNGTPSTSQGYTLVSGDT